MNHKRLRIGLLYNASRGWIGGEHYIANIIDALKAYKSKSTASGTDEIVLCYLNQEDESHLHKVFADADDFQLLEIQSSKLRRRDAAIASINLFIPQRFRLFKARPQKSWIVTDNLDVLFPFDFSYPISTCTAAIGWIPDFQPRLLPHFFSQEELAKRNKIDDRVVTLAENIVFSSLDSQQNFQNFYPDSTICSHLFYFHPSVPKDSFQYESHLTQRLYHLPDKFFICCNQFWQHKNQALLFEAIAKLHSIYPDIFVVFTGHTHDPRLTAHFDDLCASINKLGIRERIAILGLLPRQDQIQLIRQSVGVIQPSLCEGWSSIVEDVRALGKPIILSDLAVHLEQNPDQAIFFDRTSADSLQDAMRHAWLNWHSGPDARLEEEAQERSKQLVTTMAEDFLNIVHLAYDHHQACQASLQPR
jgi:glycosyltransferase involved in cell wall biosynthesis